MNSLGVVVLVPEQRQHNHRLAEVQRLGRGVVPTVSNHQVNLVDDGGLGEELCSHHVVRQLELVVLGSFAHDKLVRGFPQDIHESLHEGHIGTAQRAKRQVDEG